MTDHLIHRSGSDQSTYGELDVRNLRANGFGELAISQWRGVRFARNSLFMADFIEFVCRDARANVCGEQVKYFTRHLLKIKTGTKGAR